MTLKKFLDEIKVNNFKVIYQDFLNVKLSEYVNNSEEFYVVANIPYYITSPIIAHLLGELDDLANKNRAVIEDNCIIGANAVVTHDVPEGAVAVGIPAKIKAN